jgi:hypothetical protein
MGEEMMRNRKLKILAAIICLVVPQLALAKGDSYYDRGMKSFSAGDYVNAAQSFAAVYRSQPENSNSLYMYALCEQQLGHKENAIRLFKICCETFPDSGAATRSMSVLQKLDPVYLRHLMNNRPQFASGGGIQGVGPLVGPGISPDFTYGTQALTTNQQHYQLTLMNQAEPLKGRINGVWTTLKFASGKKSQIGLNWLRSSGLNFNPKGKAYRADITIERTKVPAFDIEVVDYTALPIKLCSDFRVCYEREVAMANETTAHQYLALHKGAPHYTAPVVNKNDPQTGTVSGPRPGEEEVVVPFRTTPDGHKIVTAQINGASVDMIIFESGTMLIGLDQLRNIDPGLMPEVKAETVGGSIRTSGDVVLRSVSIGPLIKYQVNCHAEGWGNMRIQSDTGNPREFPLLGDNFWANWRYEVDEQKKVVRVYKPVK